MKSILSLIISAALVVSGYSQTRNVLVGTNNAVVQPTNFWSADASNARSGLGLGSAATNAVSAFQPASSVLTNLSASNGESLTNLSVLNIIGTLGLGQGGTGSTNASSARTALGLGTAATNPASAFQTSSSVLTNLASSNGGVLTNITASSVTGTISISNGGSGATTAGVARTNLGLGWSALTNTNAATSLLGFTTNGQVVANTGTNVLTFTSNVIVDGSTEFSNGDISRSGNAISLENSWLVYNETVVFEWQDSQNVTYVPFAFSGTNASVNAATTRTNLGLGWAGTNAAITRTNLGLGATWLTNTNSTNFRSDIGLGWSALTNTNAGTGLVSVNTNGTVVSPTNFWTASPLGRVGYIQYSAPITNSTNSAEAARNLFVFSLAPTINGVTNTIQLPVTTNSALYGDIAVVVHQGPTNSATIVRNGIDLITLREDNEAISLLYGTNGWGFYPNLAFHEPIYFTTTNAALYAARSRTNLALGATWLTNTNVTNFRTAVGVGEQNAPRFAAVLIGDTNTSFESTIEDEGINWYFNRGTNASQPAITIGYLSNSILSFLPIVFQSNNHAATTRTNLGLGATWLTNTNVTNFRTAIGLGTTNNVEFNELRLGGSSQMHMRGSAGNISFYNGIESENVLLIPADTDPVEINSQWNDANVRSNLGLPLSALTSTNNATFQEAVFTTNAAPTNGANFGDRVGWMGVSIVTNGVTNVFRIPLYK